MTLGRLDRVLASITAGLLAACGPVPTNEVDSVASVEGTPCAQADHVPGTPGCLVSEAFDQRVVRLFQLTLTPEDRTRLPRLARNPDTESTYVPARLVIDSEDLGMVGVRFKGATGTLHECIDESFTLKCDKMSYKIKFDEFDQEMRWKGLKKINLHSMRVDPTLMHEHLAYALFRQMGIPAPRATHAQLSINGEAAGLFAQTEAPDGRFTADRFAPRGDGNLYKEVWPLSTQPDDYQGNLETNKDEPQDHASFIAFAQALQTADRSKLADVLRRFVNTDDLLRYMAVDRLTSNWDGITTFYCGEDARDSCKNHNYYWYVEELSGRFWLVPWDLDNTWKLQTDHELIMPRWNEMPPDCDQRVIRHKTWLMPPGCDRLFQGLAQIGETAYRRALEQMLAGPFQVDLLHGAIDRMAASIRPAVEADPVLDVDDWQARVDALKGDIVLLRDKGELMRDGKDFEPLGLSSRGVNDFENVAAVTFAMGSTIEPNPATNASRSLNREAPLSGAADVRADFVFRTDDRAWAWLNWWIGMEGAPVDLSRLTGMRVRLKADRARLARMEFDSSAYAERYSGVRFGWDVMVGREPATFVLRATDLAPPLDRGLKDNVASILTAVEGIMVQAAAVGLDAEGFFPPGRNDRGFVQLDELEFLFD